MRPALAYLAAEIDSLAQNGRLRAWRVEASAGPVLDACSNDYLGYGGERSAGWEPGPTGARGSRLVTGDDEAIRSLEVQLAQWVGQESALVFTSGYCANVGVLSALVGSEDLVVSDERNHASLIDGCRLSKATVRVVGHRDVEAVGTALREGTFRRRWVVAESYYSMDGTVSDVRSLRAQCDAAGAGLIVDEAHALGVFGPRGAGICAGEGVQPDVMVGTFGKAIGAQGAFVATEAMAAHWLWNRARSFVFSTGMSPLLGRVVARNVRRAIEDDGGRARLLELAARVRGRLAAAGMNVLGASTGPIIPLVVGDNLACVDLERDLLARGVHVKAIRPPTVPEGSARLRVTVRASMSARDVERLCEALVGCGA